MALPVPAMVAALGLLLIVSAPEQPPPYGLAMGLVGVAVCASAGIVAVVQRGRA